MKSFILAAFLISGAAHAGGLVDPGLKQFAQGPQTASTKVLVLLKTSPSAVNLPRPVRYDRAGVINYYRNLTRLSAQPLLDSVQNNLMPDVKILKMFWINGSILAQVTPVGLTNLANHPAVSKIYLNGRVQNDPVVSRRPGGPRSAQQAEHEYDVTSLGLDKLFAEKPQILGQNVVIGLVDTGADGKHPALAGKILSFYNGQTHKTGDPVDFDEHGTHTAGTLVGGDRKDMWIGVAPAAKLSVAGVLIDFSTMLEGMQWIIDKDKNPAGSKVKITSNSWNSQGAPDQEPFYRAIGVWEAAGVLPVFSAGNAGTGGITHPHEHPGTFTAAAYDSTLKVADFSSRGPGHYKGQTTQKPEVAAPGVDINSSKPGGGFQRMSGTSMACPHVAGTAALLLQVNPAFNPAQLRQILIKSVTEPVGKTPGTWVNDYGFGRLNSYGAVKMAAKFAQALGMQYLNKFSTFVNSVSDIESRDFAEISLGEVDGDSDQWKFTDESQWLKVSDLN